MSLLLPIFSKFSNRPSPEIRGWCSTSGFLPNFVPGDVREGGQINPNCPEDEVREEFVLVHFVWGEGKYVRWGMFRGMSSVRRCSARGCPEGILLNLVMFFFQCPYYSVTTG